MIQVGSKVRYQGAEGIKSFGPLLISSKPNKNFGGQQLEKGKDYTVREMTQSGNRRGVKLEGIENGVNRNSGNEWSYPISSFTEVMEDGSEKQPDFKELFVEGIADKLISLGVIQDDNPQVEEDDPNGVPKFFGIPDERAFEITDLLAKTVADLVNSGETKRTAIIEAARNLGQTEEEKQYLCFMAGCSDQTVSDAINGNTAPSMMGLFERAFGL